MAELLIGAGADLEAKDSADYVHLAADIGHWEVARVLIEAGLNPTAVRWTVRRRCVSRLAEDTWKRSRFSFVRKRTRC